MKTIGLSLVAVVCLSLLSSFAAGYTGGNGSVEDPFQIASVDDFLAMTTAPEDWASSFILTADIDLAGQPFSNSPIAPDISNTQYGFQGTSFTGVYDGNSHIISNLTITASTWQEYVGLFGYVGPDGQVRNLGVENVYITGRLYVGGLVGETDSGTLTACYATGSVSGDFYVGGLAGYDESGTLTDCYATGSVTGTDPVGGLVGYLQHGYINSCYFLITSGPDNSNGTPLTDEQMKQQSSFADWDFTTIWRMRCEGMNYPKLNWQVILAADLVCPDGVNFADYSFFAERWLNTDCASKDNCDGTDFDFSGTVDIADLKIFCNYWLEGQ
jgi:hypothetical protein